MISHDLMCIFIHINRNGGKSIEEAIWGVSPEYGSADHKKVVSWEKLLSEEEFNSYFKFCFCRNPWDRLVSLYCYYKETVSFHKSKFLPRDIVNSFEKFCLYIRDDEVLAPTQLSWILDESGKPNIDFIGKFENFYLDWKFLCEKIGVEREILHLNKSTYKNYEEYYNNKLVEIVRKKYKDDISFFGYEDTPY